MRFRNSIGASVAVFVLVTSRAASADTPDDRDSVLPCRPTIACTANIANPGTLEIESGALVRRLPQDTWSLTTPLLMKYTLAKWIQLQVGDNGFTYVTGVSPATYVDNVVVGPKLHLADEDGSLPSISFSAEISLPTLRGQKGYLRAYDLDLVGYVTKKFGPLEADLNVGLTEYRIDDAPVAQGLAALAFSMSLPPPFGVMAEAYELTAAPRLAALDRGTLFAFTVSPKPWLVFDIGADVGWVPSTRSYSMFAGASFVPYVARDRK